MLGEAIKNTNLGDEVKQLDKTQIFLKPEETADKLAMIVCENTFRNGDRIIYYS